MDPAHDILDATPHLYRLQSLHQLRGARRQHVVQIHAALPQGVQAGGRLCANLARDRRLVVRSTVLQVCRGVGAVGVVARALGHKAGGRLRAHLARDRRLVVRSTALQGGGGGGSAAQP